MEKLMIAATKMKQNQKHVIWAVIGDFVFFIVLGFLTLPINQKILQLVQAILGQLSSGSGIMNAASFEASVLFQPSIKPFTIKLIGVYVMLFATILVCYSIFQGIAWGMSMKIVHPIKLSKYIKSFLTLNAVWIFGFIIAHFFSLWVSFHELAAVRIGTKAPMLLIGLKYIVWILLGYFAFISYCLIGEKHSGIKQAFIVGKTKFNELLTPIFCLLVLGFVLELVLRTAFRISSWAGIIAGVVIVLPVFVYGRIVMKLAIQ